MSDAVQLDLSVTATVIVGAKWTRGARVTERQFLMPLHVRGSAVDCLPRAKEGLEQMMNDLVHQIETAGRSAERGFTYRFPRMGELMEAPVAKPGAAYPPIPEPTAEQRAAVAAMLKPDAPASP